MEWLRLPGILRATEAMETTRLMYMMEDVHVVREDGERELAPGARTELKTTLKLLTDCVEKFDAPEIASFLRRHTNDDELPLTGDVYDTVCKAFWEGVHGKSVFFLDRRAIETYKSAPVAFGDDVAKAFKGIRNEIEQAAKCLAFEFSTAAVFHLMRAMELAVNRMAEHLHATVKNEEWGGVISAMNAEIDKMPKGKERQRWSDAMKNLWHVKEATRNEVMHPRKEGYTQAQAEENFAAVKVFLTQMATLVLPPAAPAPAPAPAKPTP
jgi:hypothetical protein